MPEPKLKVSVEPIRSVSFPVESLALFMCEGEDRPAGGWRNIDTNLARKFSAAAPLEDFKGKVGEVLLLQSDDGKPAKRVLLAGLGKRSSVDTEKVRRATAAIIRRINRGTTQEVTVLLPSDLAGIPAAEQAQSVVEAANLTLYRYDRFKSNGKESKKPLSRLRLLQEREKESGELKDGARLGEFYASGTSLTRDLINEPAMTATPKKLAEVAQSLARGRRSITVKVYDEKQIRSMGMEGLMGVAAGSVQPPRFVHLHYKAPGAKKTVAVVGKGITFDSGGLCIKPADGMLNMKDDMSGAAAVLGIFSVLDDIKPRVNVHGIFGATENMPGAAAYKMRDVVRAMNGKTIEIVNTDAEGRVILADALSFASKQKPDEIIDLATLTGACVVALGSRISGIMGTDQGLTDRLIAAGRKAGEKLWQLPLDEEYWDLIKSDLADMKNSGGRWGGAITAGLLLKEFVPEGTPWAHIDMAGEIFAEKAEHYQPVGANGAMVRTVLRYLQSL